MTTYTLPDLGYDFGALEPHISGEIMKLHYTKHHQAYVDGANLALEKLAAARESGDLGNVNKLANDLAGNGGGHVNHSVVWQNRSPDGGGRPEGEVAAAIDEFFGSFDGFQKHFNETAKGLQGSGWSVLVWDTLGQRLNINQLFDQQGNLPVGQLPVLQLDMWEHAYYLQYKNVKADYVTSWWNVVNWADVAQRLAQARKASEGGLY